MNRSTPLKRTGRLKTRRPSTLWLEAKAKVLARAAGKCEVCGQAERLDVHHVIPRSKFGTKNAAHAHDPKRNLIGVCRACHEDVSAPYNEGRLMILADYDMDVPVYKWDLVIADDRRAWLAGRYGVLKQGQVIA